MQVWYVSVLVDYIVVALQYIAICHGSKLNILNLYVYVGHYIPAMADYFTTLNQDTTYHGDDYDIKVAKLAIGNGWSVPKIQYNYADFAHNLGIISSVDATLLNRQYGLCVDQENRMDFSGKDYCDILGQVLAASGACPVEKEVLADDDAHSNETISACYGPIVNIYDIRSYYVEIVSNWPAGDDVTTEYLNLASVMSAIHVNRQYIPIYEECSASGVYLGVLDGLGVQSSIVKLLEGGIPILFYNGQV